MTSLTFLATHITIISEVPWHKRGRNEDGDLINGNLSDAPRASLTSAALPSFTQELQIARVTTLSIDTNYRPHASEKSLNKYKIGFPYGSEVISSLTV